MRGLLLEEAILFLLRAAGYQTVSTVGGDPTLGYSPAGLVVRGRGAKHQIDAIADSMLGPPFSHPQRLLVEAKFYAETRLIGLSIIRSVVGTLKDVSEYWVQLDRESLASRRYHYQAAVFSASSFTTDAQDYAFAHDIYLLPLRDSSFFAPILLAISAAVHQLQKDSAGRVPGLSLAEVRRFVRGRLQPELQQITPVGAFASEWLEGIFAATTTVGKALLGVFGRAFPVLLAPRDGLDLTTLSDGEPVQIHFRNLNSGREWRLSRSGEHEPIFTFDLPERLFTHFAVDRILSPERALDLKAEFLREVQVIVRSQNELRIVRLVLDGGWLQHVREAIGNGDTSQ